MLKSYAHQSENYRISSDSLHLGTSLKGNNLLSKFFLLKVVTYGMENHFYHIWCPPLNVTIFITQICNGS